MKSASNNFEQFTGVFLRVQKSIDDNENVITELPWGIAQILAASGYNIYRNGWNGKGMFVAYSPGTPNLLSSAFWIEANRRAAEANGGSMTVQPYFTLKTAQNTIQMGWIPSAGDLTANDWCAEKLPDLPIVSDSVLHDHAVKTDDVSAFMAATTTVKPL